MFLQRRKPSSSIVVLCLLVLLCGGSVPDLCGIQKGDQEYRLNKDFLLGFYDDTQTIFSSPGRWGKKDWMTLGAVIGTGLVLFALDEEIYKSLGDHQNAQSQDISRFISHFGDGAFIVALLTGFYASGEIARSKGLRKTALLSLESWLISGAVVVGIKFLVGRARPYAEEGSKAFRPFRGSSRYYSFPSGHATSAFALASVLSDQTDNAMVDILSYGLAGLVAASRVHNNKHWVSDVFIGSALGYFIGKGISQRHDRKKEKEFAISFSGNGLTLSFSF